MSEREPQHVSDDRRPRMDPEEGAGALCLLVVACVTVVTLLIAHAIRERFRSPHRAPYEPPAPAVTALKDPTATP